MAVRLHIKDSLPPTFSGDRDKCKAWSSEFILFMLSDEPRLGAILKRLQTIRLSIMDRDVIPGVASPHSHLIAQ
eukprot:382008-Amphidinium_carterae.3